MVQKIFRGAYVDGLRRSVVEDAGILEVYATADQFPAASEADLLNTPISLPDGPPKLVAPPGATRLVHSSHDAENAITVYLYLRDLTRTQAADPRLWVTLAHTTFWEYVRNRWPHEGKVRKNVLEHWFVPEASGKAGLRRQAISRLWWAAHLTYAPWEQDPELKVFESADKFKFTRILLASQQRYFDIVERDYGSDLRLRTCLLDALDHQENRDQISRAASKRLNLLLKHSQIRSLALAGLRQACSELVGKAALEPARAAIPAGRGA